MKIMKAAILTAVSTIAVLTTQNALAEKCSGFISAKAEPAVNIMKKADGSQVMFVMNHRIYNRSEPPNHPSDGAHGTGAGLWTLGPDGKSGSGAGTVYYHDLEC